MATSALIVVGNEILTGKFADENGPLVIRRMRELGCDLLRISVIPDDIGVIATEVRESAARFDHVITSGGVGPTHDDVTLEAVARAFGRPLELRAELVELATRYGLPDNDATRRMATLPAGSELVTDGRMSYPAVRVENVWVLPGVPRLFRDKFEAISSRFAGQAVATARLTTGEHEWDIAARLTAAAARFPTVAIGSYPRFGEGPFHVVVTFEGRDAAAVHDAHAELAAALLPFASPEGTARGPRGSSS